MIKTITATGVATIMFDGDIAEAEGDGYSAALDFGVDTFTGTITEPDGTVNNLSGYHGVGDLPALGGNPCPEPTPSTPSAPSTADVVLSGDVDYPDGFTVPAGQVWEFDPTVSTTVTVGANIVVHGTLRSVPPGPGVTHRIRFVGINEANYVGGHTHHPVTSDVGLWVDGGVLDISGNQKVSWNRTGTDPSWFPTDELIVCPTGIGAFEAAPYTGGPLPTATTETLDHDDVSHTYTGEVVNLTRDFVIESVDGMAHIMFLHVTKAQRLSFVELRRLGPAGVLGRYPLHVHMNGDGSDGSVFRGNVARDCRNHAFVPHTSHGCDFTGSIAYRTELSAFWWDVKDITNRTRWDRCGAVETISGSGFELLAGIGNTCVDSFAFGTRANVSNAGLLWPSHTNGKPSEWATSGVVTHNNQSAGLRTWNNDEIARTIVFAASYRNLRGGLSFGAYKHAYRVENSVFFDNAEADVDARALGRWAIRNCWIGHLTISAHNVSSQDVSLVHTGRGWTVGRVTVKESPTGQTDAGFFRIQSGYQKNDLGPDDFTIQSQTSVIEVANVRQPSFTLTP